MKRSPSIVSVIVAIAAVSTGYGQTVQTAEPVGQAAGALAEIVVTAQKRAENLQTTPIAVTAMTGDVLAQHSITSVADLQEFVPNLTLRAAPQDGLSTVATIRGQSQQEIYLGKQPSVGLYYDGVYIAGTAGTLGNNLLDIERVEVLRGPQGTLYGRNTTGGSINIITHAPTDKLEESVTVEGGNHGLYNVEGMVNVPLIANALDLRVVGQFLHHDGYGHDLTSGVDLGDEDSRGIRMALGWHPTDKLDVIARAEYSYEFTHGEPGRITALAPGGAANVEAAAELGLPFTAAGFAAAAQRLFALIPANPYDSVLPANLNPRNSSNQSGGSVTATYALTGDLSLKSISSYRDATKYVRQDPSGVPFTFVTYLPAYTTETSTYAQELQLNGALLDSKLKIASGLYFDHFNGHEVIDDAVLPAINPGSPLIFDNAIIDKSSAIYGQGSYEVARQLSLTGGVRYTWEKNELRSQNHSVAGCDIPSQDLLSAACFGAFPNSFNAVSYTAGVDYRFDAPVLGYLKVSRGFKAGGQNELGSSVPGTYRPFKPEFALTYEAGLKSEWFEKRLRANAAVFFTDYTDIQRTIYVNVPGGVGNVTANAATGHIPGAELELEALPAQSLELRASLAYLDPKYISFTDALGDHSHDRFPGATRWQGSLSASYLVNFSPGDLRVTVDGYYQSSTDFDPDNHTIFSGVTAIQGGYGLANAQANFHVTNLDLDIAGYVKNMFDKVYYSGGIDLTGQVGFGYNYFGPPRTFGVRLTKRF